MAFFITTFRTRLRYRLRDSESSYAYSNTIIDAWGNAALEDLTVRAPHISANTTISGNGSAYSFDLSAKTRFNMLRRLHLTGANGCPIPEHPSGIAYIRAKETGAGIIAGTPDYCVVDNHITLYLDAILAATETLKLDYWQLPRTWVEIVTDETSQSKSPDGLLATGFDELILAMSAIKAGQDIGDNFGDELVAKHYSIVFGEQAKGIIGELKRFEQFAAKSSHMGNKGSVRYSDMGQDPVMYGRLGR